MTLGIPQTAALDALLAVPNPTSDPWLLTAKLNLACGTSFSVRSVKSKLIRMQKAMLAAPPIWTGEIVQRLTGLYQSTAAPSCSKIAITLNDEFGTSFSRSAVIGKIDRLGLGVRRLPEGAEPVPRKPREPRVRGPRSPIESVARITRGPQQSAETIHLRCVEIVPRHLSFDDLGPNDCRYPYGRDERGDTAPVTFCGHGKRAGSRYCVPHFHLCRDQRPAPQRRASFSIGRVA